MTVRNNRGYIVCCRECQRQNVRNENIEGYKVLTPQFASAIDSVYYGWCNVHEKEVMAMYNNEHGRIQNFYMLSSGS